MIRFFNQFFLLLAILVNFSCLKKSDDFKFLDSAEEPTAENSETIGTSAIEFEPSSYDFGPLESYTGIAGKLISVSNKSTQTVYIEDFLGDNNHFSLVGDNCPRKPEGFQPNQSCQLTVQFTPKSPGLHNMTLEGLYLASLSGASLKRNMGLSGQGISPINFSGIQSITHINHNSMTLNWDPTPDAKSFMIFRMGLGDSMNYQMTIANSGGTVTNGLVTGLDPNSSYTWRVRAIDALGNQETNTVDMTASTTVNSAPNLSPIASPQFYSGEVITNIDANDSVTGTDLDIDGDQITYSCHFDTSINNSMDGSAASCSTLLNEGGGTASFSTITGTLSGWVPQHSRANTNIEFRVVGTDPYGASNIIYFSTTILPGVPSAPSVTGINVVSPINNNNPIVYGSTGPNFTVKLYNNSNCTGSTIGQGTANSAGNFSVTATVPNNSITTIYATSTNTIGNESPCSITSVTIIEDSNPPAPLIITGTQPPSPSSNLNPAIVGITEPNATVNLYSDNSCNTFVDSASADLNGDFSISINVVAETTTQYWVRAVDAAGNTTACSSSSATYVAFPIDSENLLMWLDAAEASTLFQAHSCTGALSAVFGDPVGCWADRSGAGNHVTRSSNKPTYGTRGLYFNGTNNLLTNANLNFDANSVISYFVVTRVQAQSDNSGSCCRPLVNWVTTSANFYPWVGLIRNNLAPANNLIFGWNSSAISPQPTSSGEEHLVAAYHDGGAKQWNTFWNGTQTVTNQVIPASYTTTINLTIGGDTSSAARAYHGEIMEVIFYNTILSTSRRTHMEGYLACKWDLRDKLPPSHDFYHPNGSETAGCP